MMQRKLIIGTRGSPLALYQANLVQSLLTCESEIKIFKTSGDKLKGDLKEFGGKGLFTKELEEALMDDRVGYGCSFHEGCADHWTGQPDDWRCIGT